METLRSFDHAVLRAMGRARHPVTNALVRGVTFFGSATAGVAISTAAAAVLLLRRRRRAAAQVAIGSAGGVAAELFVKRIFRRTRPAILEHLEIVRSTSFPSGHAMAAACIYLTLAFVGARTPRLRRHRGAVIGTASAFAGTIGATRVFLGVHWPTDVLAGLALGTGWAYATDAAFDLTAA